MGDRVSRRLLWSLLLGVALSLAILIASHDEDAITRLIQHNVSDIVLKVAIAVFVGGLVLMIFRKHITKALEAALFWVVIGLLIAVGYAYRAELHEAGDRVLAELIPGRAATHGQIVEIVRGKSGDFSVHTQVNGAKVAMLLDTGATSVILTQDAAKAAGLPIDLLAYTVNVDTANGRMQAAPVTLDRIVVGGLIEREVPALVVQAGGLKSNLLGMTFLNRLDSWEVRGDKLRLRSAR
jgi:aspartyl protease family protein